MISPSESLTTKFKTFDEEGDDEDDDNDNHVDDDSSSRGIFLALKFFSITNNLCKIMIIPQYDK